MATTRLTFTASVEEQWQTVARPWLVQRANTAWNNPRPTVILTPSRAEGFYLRSRLVAEKIPFLGLRFWTPSDARKFLRAELLPDLGAAPLAEQRLLARVCAEKIGASHNASIASVVRDPGAFLRAYDLLLGAGWDPAREGAVYGRELAREMQLALKKHKIATQAGVHLQLRVAASSGRPPLLADLLVVGFNATHWPLWDLLKAAVLSAEDANVALLNPREFGIKEDSLWRGSWEEFVGSEALPPPFEAATIPVEEPFSGLVASYERDAKSEARTEAAELTFLVTPDLTSQVRSVVLQVLTYLKSDSCTRLGIVFPEPNALALGVAEELRRLGIPLDNGPGALAPGPFEKRCWQSWIALQEEPGVPTLIAWLRACEAQGVSCGLPGLLSARDVANALESALGECLVDDLDFLARQIQSGFQGRDASQVADFLSKRIALPEETTFEKYIELTRKAVSLPGWEKHLDRVKIDPPAWMMKRREALSRRTFLEWLKEAADSQVWTSGAEGNHFYGKVHLIIYGQMTGQTWSHLILTGLNEGVWPRLHEAGAFGSHHELTELNRQSRRLNVAGETQGGQGEGHDTVIADHGHCLLPLERQALALRDLCAALDSTSVAATLTAMTTEGGRSLLPSDFFSHAYQFQTGNVLNEAVFRSLAETTRDWCGHHRELIERRSVTDGISIEATLTAYTARRDSTQPFGPYEFSYAQPPARRIQLSCKEWDHAWNHPASAWLGNVVGVSAWPEGTLSWPKAIGIWVHRWLAAALRDCRERKSTNEFPVLIWAEADRDAAAIRSRAEAQNLALYPWWEQVWNRAKTRSLQLGESLAPLLPDHLYFSEFKLPGDLMIKLPGSEQADFQLKGRIDFLQVEKGDVEIDPKTPDFAGRGCWVIDFKTGSSKSLSLKSVLAGTGLQAVLYGVAIGALGAKSTSVSMVAPEADAKKQIEMSSGINPILAALDKLHRDGVFGMRADAESEYGFAPGYPIATQFISPSILEAKWARTHGKLAEVES
jgi:hypothetical protein